jgi:hypothetical protein
MILVIKINTTADQMARDEAVRNSASYYGAQ